MEEKTAIRKKHGVQVSDRAGTMAAFPCVATSMNLSSSCFPKDCFLYAKGAAEVRGMDTPFTETIMSLLE